MLGESRGRLFVENREKVVEVWRNHFLQSFLLVLLVGLLRKFRRRGDLSN